jgi:hypothetical protein
LHLFSDRQEALYIQQLVYFFCTYYVSWLHNMHKKYTNCCTYSASWWWANKCLKHVEAINHNQLKENSACCWYYWTEMQLSIMKLFLCQTNYFAEVISLSLETVTHRFCYNLKISHHHHYIFSHRLQNNILCTIVSIFIRYGRTKFRVPRSSTLLVIATELIGENKIILLAHYFTFHKVIALFFFKLLLSITSLS